MIKQAPTVISSNDVIDFDSHIKISAGPGAGKTTWLARQIAHVAKHSRRLHKASKIICISYTNAASEAIRRKLGQCADIVETSTIHSFLFSNVVRPYLHMLRDESGQCLAAHALVQNHYEPNPTYGRVDKWLTEVHSKYKKTVNNSKTYAYIKKALWQRDCDGTWKCAPIKWTDHPEYMPTTKLDIYKGLLWKKGIIEHDDVLYLAYQILEKHPCLAYHFSAKFPYIYVDEFQDTDPRQTQILKWIAQSGCCYIGVIGDAEQAIFGFCGANREDFSTFSLPGTKEYIIEDNRRSTNSIIAILNNARNDGLKQKGLRNEDGSHVSILVGDICKAYEKIKGLSPVMLARNNEDADLLRTKDFIKKNNEQNPWAQLEAIDLDRYLFIKAGLEAFILLQSGKPDSSVRKFLDGFRVKQGISKILTNAPYITDAIKRALALTILCTLREKYDALRGKTFLETYNELGLQISGLLPGTVLKKITKGKMNDYASKFTLQQLLDTANMVDDTRDAKTIHKAKGAEFDTVLVYLPKEEDLTKIITPEIIPKDNADQLEEQRILYVGISRARDNLYIALPSLSDERAKLFADRKLPIEIVHL